MIREMIFLKRKFKVSADTTEMVGQAFQEFMIEKTAMNRSKTTLRNYQQSYDMFIEYHEIDETSFPIGNIQMPLVYKWINHMKNNEVRPTSINHYLRDFRTFMNWCYERDKIEVPVEIKEIEAQEELPKMYSDEEMAIMLEKPRAGDGFSDWRTWAIVSTVYATGLRASTICSLQIEDISFQREEIVIEKQKNKHAGVLPLTHALANVLNEYIKKWMGINPDPSDWLFPSITGEQFNVGALNHSIDRYCKARGIKGHGCHSIRHNFSRDMIVNGAGEYRLQKYLQHSSIQMSQHYVKLFSEDLKKDAEEYSPLDNAKKKSRRTSVFKKTGV